MTNLDYSCILQDEGAVGGVDAFYRGQLKVGLKYLPSEGSKAKGSLVIDVKQARELPAMDRDSTDAAVKLHLLPNRKSSGKRKTGVIKNSLNPIWEEKFTYEDVTLEELSHEQVLEVSVWNYDKSGNSFIGGLRLGPTPGSAAKHKDWMDSIGDEVTHWEDMLASPGEWVEHWHTLRTTLNPRNVDVQAPLPPTSHAPPHTPPTALQEESAVFSPVLLANEFQKTGSPKVPSAEEKIDVDARFQASVVGSTNLPPTSSYTSHPTPPVEQESATFSPVLLTDEFKKTAPPKLSNVGEEKEPKVPSVEEKKAADARVQASVVGSIELPPLSSYTSHPTPPVEQESATFSPVLLTDEFKKTEPPNISNVGEEKEQESPIDVSKVCTVDEKMDSPPLRPKSISGATKPVFSSSVRNRPAKATVRATTQTQEVRKDIPKDDSGNTHILQTPLSLHVLGQQTNEEESPVNTMEEERTPPTTTSTPLSKDTMDLSEVGAYAESPVNVGSSHVHQVRYSVYYNIMCMNNKYPFENTTHIYVHGTPCPLPYCIYLLGPSQGFLHLYVHVW